MTHQLLRLGGEATSRLLKQHHRQPVWLLSLKEVVLAAQKQLVVIDPQLSKEVEGPVGVILDQGGPLGE
jgi:hypothetical protein